MVQRKVSIDILRIIATCQVISRHCFEYPLKLSTCFKLPFVSECFFSLMTTCNVHFMLISSYLASKSRFFFTKQIPIIFTNVFYSLFSYFLSIVFFKCSQYKYDLFIIYLFPIANTIYWYIGPFLLSSMICSMIYPTFKQHTSKYQFTFTFIIFLLYSIQFVGYYTNLGLDAWKFSSFHVVSLFSSIIRFNDINIKLSIAIIIFFLMWIHQYYIYSHQTDSLHWYIRIFWIRGLLHPSTILFGITSFIVALKINFQTKYANFLKILAELSLPIYMIHFHPLNKHIWIKPLMKYQNQLDIYWKYNFISVFKIFIVSGLIEIIHKKISELILYKREYFNNIIQYFN